MSDYDVKKLIELAVKLRDQLHGFREMFDERDPSSGRLIAEFDEFVGDAERDAAVSHAKPHWRTPDDTSEIGYVGDRIVAICQWSEQHDRVVKLHVITLTIHEDSIRDNEDQGYCLHDCDYWMPEAEFLRLFGPEVKSDTPPDAAPWQGQDGWEGRQ